MDLKGSAAILTTIQSAGVAPELNLRITKKAKPEWPSGLQRRAVLCCVWHRRSWVRAQNLDQCLWTRLQIRGSKRLGCHADLYSQQVSHQRWLSGIHCMQATKHASEGSTLALKPRGDVARSLKQGYQWPHKKDSCPLKIYFKKKVSKS